MDKSNLAVGIRTRLITLAARNRGTGMNANPKVACVPHQHLCVAHGVPEGLEKRGVHEPVQLGAVLRSHTQVLAEPCPVHVLGVQVRVGVGHFTRYIGGAVYSVQTKTLLSRNERRQWNESRFTTKGMLTRSDPAKSAGANGV